MGDFFNYFLGGGGISPFLASAAATALAGDESFPIFQSFKYFHGETIPRRTHQIFGWVSVGVGQEIPKCRWGLVPLALPVAPILPNICPAFTLVPG